MCLFIYLLGHYNIKQISTYKSQPIVGIIKLCIYISILSAIDQPAVKISIPENPISMNY